jgi:hypothetical protein
MRRGVVSPLPHAFAAKDSGKPERQYRAWVKKSFGAPKKE